MGILEEIKKMRNDGIGDQDIVSNLQQRGVSPKEINDALSREKIKSAVSDNRVQEMEPSIMQQTNPVPSPQETYSPQSQEISGQEMYPPQQEYSQEFYPEEGYEYQSGGIDTNTIIEVAEQVFSEKIKKLKKQIDEINEFKTLAQIKIENAGQRLKRIESIIDRLQASILEKVGSYGENLENIKKEMSMMQDSFGKIINPLLDSTRRHATQVPTPHKTPVYPRKKTSRKR